ncbi:Dihydromethanopterin reductase [Methylocella tundrae]|uniref:Dihydromethanopterin reductase n=1 Tax=Methylocella tundrae TaxID=227605 RepID=A0A8B6LZ41_METTU|nr:dihydrofolate reductase [Methylocella tundrae]VTZ48051.1 Dihydromethanopterin reductase [Methylocella tundrae]
MGEVRVICAIGQRGQLGLNGALPWEGNPGREYRADVARFFELTKGHVLIAGPCTIGSFPDWARPGRTLVVVRSTDDPKSVLERFSDRLVFIGGGPPVWRAYAPFVQHWDVTRLPYDGEADRYFDPAWLTAAASRAD